MKERKAVFFDIDGTLFLRGSGVPESAVRAIHKLRENGHLAFVCSGRSRIMIPDDPILNIGFDGVVAACGMYASYGDKILFSEEMTKEQLEGILPILRETGTTYILEGTEYLYYDEQTIGNEHEDWLAISVAKSIPGHFLPMPEKTEDVRTCKITIHQVNAENTKRIVAQAEKDFNIMLHNQNFAEFVPKDFSKAEGIRRVCEILGVSREDTFAVGDSINDVDMLDYAGCGIVMGNGTEVAKEHADYITTRLDEDGILNALKHFSLI
jgi:hypothetical protein